MRVANLELTLKPGGRGRGGGGSKHSTGWEHSQAKAAVHTGPCLPRHTTGKAREGSAERECLGLVWKCRPHRHMAPCTPSQSHGTTQYRRAGLHACIPACVPPSLPAHLPSVWPPALLPSHLPACSLPSACPPAHFHDME